MYLCFIFDRVVEFKKCSRGEAFTPIGQYTGLDPFHVYVRWYPDNEYFRNSTAVHKDVVHDPCRVGYHILTKMPGRKKPISLVAQARDGHMFTPKEFDPKSGAIFMNCIEKVQRKWNAPGNDVVKSWLEWSREDCPKSLTASEYIAAKNWRNVPLVACFYSDFIVEAVDWTLSAFEMTFIDSEFTYPPGLAMALPTVVTRFQTQATPPRLYVANTESLKQQREVFITRSENYYKSKLDEQGVDDLKRIIRHRRNSIATSGKNKKQLQSIIKENDKMIFASHYRELVAEHRETVRSSLMEWHQSVELYRKPLASVTSGGRTCQITVGQYLQMQTGSSFSAILMQFIMSMYQKHDNDVFESQPENSRKWKLALTINIYDSCIPIHYV